jgi:16S rRNA (guanine527-N7)-methyltransferase
MGVTLVEPSRKKCAFLRHLVRVLSLENVAVIERRVEEVDQCFDVVVTRALFTIGDLLKKARNQLRKGGFFIVSKGPGFREEVRGLPEGTGVEAQEVRLPGTGLTRVLLKVVPGQKALC